MASIVKYFHFLLFLSLIASTNSFSQEMAVADDKEIPPKTYIKTLKKEADAAFKVKLIAYHLDSCKTCTSTGVRYIVEAEILKTYFTKGKKIQGNPLNYTSAADSLLYNNYKELIVFLNTIQPEDIGNYKAVSWTARQAAEFKYTPETESYIK